MQNEKKAPVVDPVYDGMIDLIQARVNAALKDKDARLYTTKACNLFEVYLTAFAGDYQAQQHHNCNACRSFIDRYGGLVTIDEEGTQRPIMWPGAVPMKYQPAVNALADVVRKSEVNGIFYAGDPVLGHPVTNGWTHFAVTLPREYMKLNSLVATPGQMMAAKREDRDTVLRALVDYDVALLDQVVAILEADALTRSEKFIGPAKWLAGLGRMVKETQDWHARNNLLWRAIALAPAGFCHPRAGMLGTLYDDLQMKLPFEDVKRRFAEKMHPLQYQRPTTPPKDGAIDQAEKLAAQLGIINSLKRRMLRLDEVDALWRPKKEDLVDRVESAFGHLRKEPKKPTTQQIDAGVMTWDKFQRTLLPKARDMQVHVGWGPHSFVAFTTAADKDAPPIIQWDKPDRRNPVAWYLYHGGSSAERFHLTPDTWAKVAAIVQKPSKWYGEKGFEHQGDSVTFCLEGCKDILPGDAGLALFPELMRNELHGVRAVIEAHSRTGKLEDAGGPEAAGLLLEKSAKNPEHIKVRVTDDTGTTTEVEIDRWD